MNEDMFEKVNGEEELVAETVEETVEETAPEVQEEVVEEVIEEVAPEVQEVAEEEVFEDAFETEDDFSQVSEEIFEGDEELFEEELVLDEVIEEPKKNIGAKVVISILIVLAILAAGFGVYKFITRNPYNAMGYVNISGRTVADIAAESGMTVEEFLVEYSLPADMPADTDEAAAYYNIPTQKIAEMYGMTTDQIKEMLGLGDDVTAATPWGEAEGKATVGKYVGEENFESFKAEYELGDDVTMDTLWGEIRREVDLKTLEMQNAQEAEADVDVETDADVVADVETDAEAEDSVAE